jgi:hypothetical protein
MGRRIEQAGGPTPKGNRIRVKDLVLCSVTAATWQRALHNNRVGGETTCREQAMRGISSTVLCTSHEQTSQYQQIECLCSIGTYIRASKNIFGPACGPSMCWAARLLPGAGTRTITVLHWSQCLYLLQLYVCPGLRELQATLLATELATDISTRQLHHHGNGTLTC